MSKKFQFVMNEKFESLLSDLQTRLGKETMTEVVREALETLDWVTTMHERGLEVVAQPQAKRNVIAYSNPSRGLERVNTRRSGT